MANDVLGSAPAPGMEDALDFARFEEIERLSDLASSCCRSLAAGDKFGR